jgi:hypothetical protein
MDKSALTWPTFILFFKYSLGFNCNKIFWQTLDPFPPNPPIGFLLLDPMVW